MKIKYLAIILILIGVNLCFSACEDEVTETKLPVTKIDHHGTAELNIRQKVSDSFYIITTTTGYFDEHEQLLKTVIHIDTLPVLSITKDTLDTGRTYEDNDGDTQPVDTVITHRKAYQFFVTIK